MARNRIDERQDTHVARSRSLTSASDLLLAPQTLHVNGPINCPRGAMESPYCFILPESDSENGFSSAMLRFALDSSYAFRFFSLRRRAGFGPLPAAHRRRPDPAILPLRQRPALLHEPLRAMLRGVKDTRAAASRVTAMTF
jgi:hypothetical protein